MKKDQPKFNHLTTEEVAELTHKQVTYYAEELGGDTAVIAEIQKAQAILKNLEISFKNNL